jgi:excisionase family DNA binding protein
MNDQITSVLKELKAEKAKIDALIEKVQEARFTELKDELHKIAKTSCIASAHSVTPAHRLEGYCAKADVARYLNVSVRTVDLWRSRHIIPYFKIGGMVRFRLEDIDRALEEKFRIQSAYEYSW